MQNGTIFKKLEDLCKNNINNMRDWWESNTGLHSPDQQSTSLSNTPNVGFTRSFLYLYSQNLLQQCCSM